MATKSNPNQQLFRELRRDIEERGLLAKRHGWYLAWSYRDVVGSLNEIGINDPRFMCPVSGELRLA
jgi:hypothetical protein